MNQGNSRMLELEVAIAALAMRPAEPSLHHLEVGHAHQQWIQAQISEP